MELRLRPLLAVFLFSNLAYASLGLTIVKPRALSKMQLQLCSGAFSIGILQKTFHEIENSSTHYSVNYLNFVYDYGLNVGQVFPSDDPDFWPSTSLLGPSNFPIPQNSNSMLWDHNYTTNDSNTLLLEWNQENEIFNTIGKNHHEFWKTSAKKLIRQRSGFDFDAYTKVVDRLPPQRTILYNFSNNNEHMVFRVYDSSIDIKSPEGTWGQTKKVSDRSLAEWKYFDDIPEFRELLEKYRNIIAVEGFAATKKWLDPQKTMYSEVARYIDQNYNESLYTAIRSTYPISIEPLLVIGVVPAGISKLIHRDLNYNYLRDDKGKNILTKDGYEIIYVKAEDLLKQYLNEPQIPVLKEDRNSQKMLFVNQKIEKGFQKYFQEVVSHLKEYARKADDPWPRITQIREETERISRAEIAQRIYPDRQISEAQKNMLDQLLLEEQSLILVDIFISNNFDIPKTGDELNDFGYTITKLYHLHRNRFLRTE